MSDLLTQDDELDVALPSADADDIDIALAPLSQAVSLAEPLDAPQAEPVALVSAGLMAILPADFPIPVLAKFVPNQALKVAADEATAYALSLKVEGAEGIERADLALGTLRACLKVITDHFAEPADIANRLHKSLTGTRAEWLAPGEIAIKAVGQRVWAERRRLDEIAAEERRRLQAEADRIERERRQKEVAEARKAQAPAPIVQQLEREAQTATAPPVATPIAAPKMTSTTVTTTWKSRFAGAPADADPHPDIETLTPHQRQQLSVLLQGILGGTAPVAAIAINWSYLDKRAKADKSALQIPGIEAYEEGGVRAKGSRGRA